VAPPMKVAGRGAMLADGGGDLDGFILCVLAAIADEDVDVADVQLELVWATGAPSRCCLRWHSPDWPRPWRFATSQTGPSDAAWSSSPGRARAPAVDAFWRPWLTGAAGSTPVWTTRSRDGMTSTDENVRKAWIGIRAPRPSSQDQQLRSNEDRSDTAARRPSRPTIHRVTRSTDTELAAQDQFATRHVVAAASAFTKIRHSPCARPGNPVHWS
jgi:hypothetical protein